MQNKNITEFINTYKTLENLLREKNPDTSVLEYENTLPAAEGDKLRICRQLRNYIQHHEDGEVFISISDNMIKFLKLLITQIESEEKKVIDRVYRLGAIELGEKLINVVERFSKTKREWLPVVDNNGMFLGILSYYSVFNAILAAGKLNSKLDDKMVIKKLKEFTIDDGTSSLKSVLGKEGSVIIVKNDKYIGVLRPSNS